MPKKLSMDLLSTDRWEREPEEGGGATAGGLEGHPPPPASGE